MNTLSELKHKQDTAGAKCIGMVKAMISNCVFPSSYVDMATEIVSEYLEAEALRSELLDAEVKRFADESVKASDWVGDHCGYLAAQAIARMAMMVDLTPDQAEAWKKINDVNIDMEPF